jgi:hypothetical protein
MYHRALLLEIALKESMQKQGRTKVRDAVRKRMGKAASKETWP